MGEGKKSIYIYMIQSHFRKKKKGKAFWKLFLIFDIEFESNQSIIFVWAIWFCSYNLLSYQA